MSKRRHLFFITEKDGRSLTVVNGIVSTRNTPTPLRYNPIGSKDIQIMWERDIAKAGIFRNFTTALEFIRDAKKILQKTHYKETEERELYLLIKRMYDLYDPTYFEEKHLYLYKGRLDFYSVEDKSTSLKISIAENSIVKALDAKEGTDFSFPLKDSEAVTVYHDGLLLDMKQNFVLPESSPVNLADDGLVLLGIEPTVSEGESSSFSAHGVFYDEAEPSFTVMQGDTRYFMRTKTPLTGVRIRGVAKFFPLTKNGSYSVQLRTSQGRTINVATVPVTVLKVYEVPFDITFDTQQDERFFFFHVRSGASSWKVVKVLEGWAEITFKSRHPASYIDCFPINVVNRKLAEKITGATGVAQSTLLDNNSDLLLTSGDGLRGIEGAELKTSYKTYYEACKVLFAAGQSIEQDKILIENHSRYYDFTNPVDLGDVKEFVSSVANEYIYTELKFGFDPQSIEGVNGKSSFHGTHVYSTPRKTAQSKTLSLVCPYIPDPYAQEIIRLNLQGKTTTDSNTDNKVYLIDSEVVPQATAPAEFIVEGSEYFIKVSAGPDILNFLAKKVTITGTTSNNGTFTIETRSSTGTNELTLKVTEPVVTESATITINFHVRRLKRPVLSNVTGIPNPEAVYNILLSPGYLLPRWQTFLNSIFFRLEGKRLTFESTSKNRDLEYTIAGKKYVEDADIIIGSNRLFIPRFFNFSVPAPINMNDLLENDQNRSFIFSARGIPLAGLNFKSSIALTNGIEQTFRLLCSPDVDISKLA